MNRSAGPFIFAFLVVVLFILALNHWVAWSTGDQHGHPRNPVGAEILEIDPSIPPAATVEIENRGGAPLGKIHVRLEFKALNGSFNQGRDWSLVSRDIFRIEPGEKKRLVLRCPDGDFSEEYRKLGRKKVAYFVMVYPEWRDPIPPLNGVADLQ
jgi:hypothetical protein